MSLKPERTNLWRCTNTSLAWLERKEPLTTKDGPKTQVVMEDTPPDSLISFSTLTIRSQEELITLVVIMINIPLLLQVRLRDGGLKLLLLQEQQVTSTLNGRKVTMPTGSRTQLVPHTTIQVKLALTVKSLVDTRRVMMLMLMEPSNSLHSVHQKHQLMKAVMQIVSSRKL